MNNNKTTIIVIIAIVAVCWCLLVSCCASTLFVVSKQNIQEVVQNYSNNDNKQPILENAEPTTTVVPMNETENVEQENTDAADFTKTPDSVEPTADEDHVTPSEDTEEAPIEADADPSDGVKVEMTAEITSADTTEKPAGEKRELSDEEQTIIEATEKTRELSAEDKFAPVYLTTEELRAQLMKEVEAESDENYAKETGLFRILGFVPDDFDLKQFYVDLYAEQIAGYYDPKENQMYLISDMSDYENASTLAHEYTHYLQYNNSEFADALNLDDLPKNEYGERSIIINAITEGDATLAEALLDVDILLENYDDIDDPEENTSSVFDSAPKYFQDNLLFPYSYGFDFVWYAYLQGGWDAVNALYENVPESVEQIMHPEKYLKDHPVDINPEPFRSAIVKDEKDVVAETVLNEADVLTLLSSAYDPNWRISERQATVASEGWGGGYYIYTSNDQGELFFTKLVWDSVDDAKEAETAFKLYSDARFETAVSKSEWKSSDGSSVYLVRRDDILYWMILPSGFDSTEILELVNNGMSM